jgi:transcriptional regulator with AAA-type ATPase domain
MLITGQTLFAFVDLKDPFAPTGVEGEEQPGPILSLLAAQPFDFLFLFHTTHTSQNAEATQHEIRHRYPSCRVTMHNLPISDPKDYSSLMGQLALEVGSIRRLSRATQDHICVSSGTAEMRAAWFLLAAVGVLPAKLLQVGSPAAPLFGAANVKEVRLDTPDWTSLRDLVMPIQYFDAGMDRRPARHPVDEDSALPQLSRRESSGERYYPRLAAAEVVPEPLPGLEDALQELGIFIGSALLREVAEQAAVVAPTGIPVLLLGETGTGKELFARLLHRLSDRRGGKLVPLNCAAIPKELVESHLFGHVKGAFTGATQDQHGKFREANRGTLFLDEIGELTPEAQAKLLRVLEDGLVEPLGSNKPQEVDVRIIAATNRNLPDEVAAGRFRKDLYFRLETVKIRLPGLRDRRSEIPMLAMALLDRINQRLKRQRQLSREALRRLEQHDWPGNVRELRNVLERSVLYARTNVLGPEELLISKETLTGDPLTALPEPGEGFFLEDFLAKVRKHLFLRALAKVNGNQAAAAGLLGVSKQAVNKFVTSETDNAG